MIPYIQPQGMLPKYIRRRTRTGMPWKKRFRKYRTRSGWVPRRQWRFGGLQNLESKHFSQNLISQQPLDTGILTHMNQYPQGVASTQRIGDATTTTKIGLRVSITNLTTTKAGLYKIMIIYDKQPNGALPGLSDLFVGAGTNPLDFSELDNRHRFKVLMTTGPFTMGATGNDNGTRCFEVYLDTKLSTSWNGSLSTIGATNSGSIILLLLSDNSLASETHLIDLQYRMRFDDTRYTGPPKVFKSRRKGNIWMG